MSHRRIVIGDVHGYYEPLLRLLETIKPDSDDDIYFLGDLIDRGPDSAKVVEFVRQGGYPCLRGNHEQMLLDAIGSGAISHNLLQAWLYSGGYNTIISYDHNIPKEHLDWFHAMPNYIDLGDAWLVHAGLHPDIPLEKQDSEQFCWIREEFHSMPEPFFPDKLIVTGHTITFTFPGVKPGELVAGAGWLDIETGVYHEASGWLTALDLGNELVYQVNQKTGKQRQLPLEDVTVIIDPRIVGPRKSRRTA
jgi:serine/threonine protein phosphatase 1